MLKGKVRGKFGARLWKALNARPRGLDFVLWAISNLYSFSFDLKVLFLHLVIPGDAPHHVWVWSYLTCHFFASHFPSSLLTHHLDKLYVPLKRKTMTYAFFTLHKPSRTSHMWRTTFCWIQEVTLHPQISHKSVNITMHIFSTHNAIYFNWKIWVMVGGF